MTIREATAGDAPTLGALFHDAVTAGGPRHYTPEQVSAWAAAARDPEAYGRRMLAGRVFVAEDASGALGFAALEEGGYVSALYVRADRQGEGIGAALLAAIVRAAAEAGVPSLHAEASEGSLPVFLRAGFALTGRETVVRGGVAFERHLVRRDLLGGGNARS